MIRWKGSWLGALAVAGVLLTAHPVAQRGETVPPGIKPTNDLPNPYETIEGWDKMPAGRTWGATSAVAIDNDGTSIWVGERCGANACAGSDLPPILHFDANGNVLTMFGSGLLLSPHGILVDRDGNIWAIDCACTTGGGGRGTRGAPGAAAATPAPAPPPAPKGHQIFKFRPDGTLL